MHQASNGATTYGSASWQLPPARSSPANGCSSADAILQQQQTSPLPAVVAPTAKNAECLLHYWKSEAVERYKRTIMLHAISYNLCSVCLIFLTLHVMLPLFQLLFVGPFTSALQSPITFFLAGDGITRVIVIFGILLFTILHAWIWCTFFERNMTSIAPLHSNRVHSIRSATRASIANLPLLCAGFALYCFAGIFLFGLWMQPTTVNANPLAILVGHSVLECQLVPLRKRSAGETLSSSITQRLFLWLGGGRADIVDIIDAESNMNDAALRLMARSCSSAFSKAIFCSAIMGLFVIFYALWYFMNGRNFIYSCSLATDDTLGACKSLPLIAYSRKRRTGAVTVASLARRYMPFQHYLLQAKCFVTDYAARQATHAWYVPSLRECCLFTCMLLFLYFLRIVSVISRDSYHDFIHMADAYVALRIIIMGLWRMQSIMNDSFMSICAQPVHFGLLNWAELLREDGAIANLMSISPEHGHLILQLMLNDAGDALFFEQGLSLNPSHGFVRDVEEIVLCAMSYCDTLNAQLAELNRYYECQVEAEEINRLYMSPFSVAYWTDLYAGALLANAFAFSPIYLAALKVLRVFAHKYVNSPSSYIMGAPLLPQIGKLMMLLQSNATKNSFLFTQFDREVTAIREERQAFTATGRRRSSFAVAGGAGDAAVGSGSYGAERCMDAFMSMFVGSRDKRPRRNALSPVVDNLLQQREVMFTALETALAQI